MAMDRPWKLPRHAMISTRSDGIPLTLLPHLRAALSAALVDPHLVAAAGDGQEGIAVTVAVKIGERHAADVARAERAAGSEREIAERTTLQATQIAVNP